MAFNITVPWKMHLTGAGTGGRKWRNWFCRNKIRGDLAHPTLMKEQDLDHLGTLHEASLRTKKRYWAGFGG